jgi:hypothetical protein
MDTVPAEVLELIAHWLDDDALRRLAQTNRAMCRFVDQLPLWVHRIILRPRSGYTATAESHVADWHACYRAIVNKDFVARTRDVDILSNEMHAEAARSTNLVQTCDEPGRYAQCTTLAHVDVSRLPSLPWNMPWWGEVRPCDPVHGVRRSFKLLFDLHMTFQGHVAHWLDVHPRENARLEYNMGDGTYHGLCVVHDRFPTCTWPGGDGALASAACGQKK